jgi:iron complex transport system permease protein
MRSTAVYGLALSLLALAMVASLAAGRVWIAPTAFLDGLAAPGAQTTDLILMELRLPRAILAVLIGAALGVSGAALQGLLRNPLAEPALLGVSGGASLGAVLAIYFGLSASFSFATPVLGMVGALAAVSLTLAIGRGGGSLTLILAGAAVASLCVAGVSLALNFAPNPYAVFEITIWLLGSLTDRGWDHVFLAAPFIVLGGVMMLTTGRALDALSLGEAQARSLGVNLERVRILVFLGAALAVGAATAVAGAIGFVGLVAPHLVRPFVGHEPGRVLVPSALVGAALLLTADVATRITPTISEIRLGVLTSLIGLPFFFWLVIRMKRKAP